MRSRWIIASALCTVVVVSSASAQFRPPWPQIKEFGGAKPKNEARWIGADDYPTKALRDDVQGNVIVTFDITADGKATNCVVESSSGSAILDEVPCPLIERKARFKPALAEGGTPKDTKARLSVPFWLP